MPSLCWPGADALTQLLVLKRALLGLQKQLILGTSCLLVLGPYPEEPDSQMEGDSPS